MLSKRHNARPFGLLLIGLVFLVTSSAVAQVATTSHDYQAVLPPLSTLQKGGLVFFMRHGQTDVTQTDQSPLVLDKCDTQRNLSSEGIRQSQEIGQIIKDKQIPIGEVLSSPFCRCQDTAKLVFGTFKTADFLHYSIGLTKAERSQITAQLKDTLQAPPPPGTNYVLVSHTGNLREAAGIWPKPEGVTWVFEPTGNGLNVIGKIGPDQWNNLK